MLLVVAAGLMVVSALNVWRVPDWAPWRVGVLVGEYGHWFVVLPLALAIAAWFFRATGGFTVPIMTALCGATAVVLLLRPSFSAWRVARELRPSLAREFGHVPLDRPAFTVRELFARANSPAVAIETKKFSRELELDLYRAPRRASAASARASPCVIVVHGGGWDSGDRTQLRHFNAWLASRGYTVVAISYRLAPKFQWPAQREDVLAAIAFLKSHAAELGIDAKRLVLFGRSAGGQIAETLAYTANDPAIRGVVALYAPADLIFGYENTHENDALRSPALMRQYLGGTPTTARGNYESASAHYHVRRGVPPTLLVHGLNDTLVWHRHSERLAARLAEHEVPHAFVRLPWATHAFDYNLNGPGGQLTRFAVEWFLAAVTRELP